MALLVLGQNTQDQSKTNNQDLKPKEARSSGGYVPTTHGLATDARLEILRLGENATDATAAVQFALSVVQPQSTGIGAERKGRSGRSARQIP